MIKIAKSDLETALKVVTNTFNKSASDIASHFLFRVKDKSLSILSSNGLRIFSSCPVVSASDADVMFTSEGWRVQELINAVPAGTLLTLDPRGSEVGVSVDRGKIEFSSLDPSSFPFWDDTLANAKETAKIPANRLKDAFQHANMFICADEGRTPQLCVAEFRDGVLYSTDQTAVSTVRVVGMEKSSIRLHNSDVPNLISFLDSAKETEVTVLEHERAMLVVRSDGAIFGSSIFGSRFPEFDVDWDLKEDQEWTIFKEDYAGDVRFLRAGAVRNDVRITLEPKGSNVLSLTMASANGKPMTVDLKAQSMVARDGSEALPEGGVPVSHKHLGLALSTHSATTVVLGVTKRNKGGWVRVRDERNGDTYMTTVAWIKKA